MQQLWWRNRSISLPSLQSWHKTALKIINDAVNRLLHKASTSRALASCHLAPSAADQLYTLVTCEAQLGKRVSKSQITNSSGQKIIISRTKPPTEKCVGDAILYSDLSRSTHILFPYEHGPSKRVLCPKRRVIL